MRYTYRCADCGVDWAPYPPFNECPGCEQATRHLPGEPLTEAVSHELAAELTAERQDRDSRKRAKQALYDEFEAHCLELWTRDLRDDFEAWLTEP